MTSHSKKFLTAAVTVLVVLCVSPAVAVPPASQDTPTLRIVQITDIHASQVKQNPRSRYPGDPLTNDLVRSLPILRATVEYVNQRIRPDVVVVTGDLTDRGDDLASLREVKTCLDRLMCRYHPVIGDHDRREVYEQVFAGKLDYGVDCGRWRLVALDANRGRLEPGTLQWLRGDLAGHRDRDTILLLHRPIVLDEPTQRLAKDIYSVPPILENAADVQKLLGISPQVKLVLCGHIHVPSDATAGGIRFLATPALAIKPPCVRLIEISKSQIASHLLTIPPEEERGK